MTKRYKNPKYMTVYGLNMIKELLKDIEKYKDIYQEIDYTEDQKRKTVEYINKKYVDDVIEEIEALSTEIPLINTYGDTYGFQAIDAEEMKQNIVDLLHRRFTEIKEV